MMPHFIINFHLRYYVNLNTFKKKKEKKNCKMKNVQLGCSRICEIPEIIVSAKSSSLHYNKEWLHSIPNDYHIFLILLAYYV